MGRVEGKVCLITGGAIGLGRADAELLAREGAQVIITDVNETAGRRTAEELGPRVSFIVQDVSVEEDWERVMRSVVERHGRLDVLVNNAGIVEFTDIETASAAQWRRVNAVSSDGTFFGCKHAIRTMRAHPGEGSRSIVNMASIAAVQGYSSIVAYAAAKGAIRAMTRSVAAHCQEKELNIRCNALLPGNMDTPMVRNLLGELASAIPMGTAADVANAVLFLASDESRFVNGTELVIDNGATIKPA
jgi:3(or 17)beta-hydroxysteroid dehydrogenase